MVRKQIATFLNNYAEYNDLASASGWSRVAEDLSNVGEYGELISSLSSENLKDFKNQFITEINTYVREKIYNTKTYGMLKKTEDWLGAQQRAMAKGRLEPQNSYLGNHTSGVNYHDGKFYDVAISGKLYTETGAFKIVHSVDDIEFIQYFKNADTIMNFVSLRESVAETSINYEIQLLCKRALMLGIAKAYENGNIVHMVTEYNNEMGYTGANVKTLAQIKQDTEEFARYTNFSRGAVARLYEGMAHINTKYNDGTVETFAEPNEITTLMLSQFANDINFMSYAKSVDTIANVETTPCWQTTGTSLLPNYNTTAKLVITDGEDETTITNLVGVMFDTDSVGVRAKFERITEERVGAEGFTNYHHHVITDLYADSRLSFILIAQD